MENFLFKINKKKNLISFNHDSITRKITVDFTKKQFFIKNGNVYIRLVSSI